MNLFYLSLDNRISKFKVYNVHTMADEFMVVSGMPNRIGKIGSEVQLDDNYINCSSNCNWASITLPADPVK